MVFLRLLLIHGFRWIAELLGLLGFWAWWKECLASWLCWREA